MKKIFSALLAAVLMILLAFSASSAECEHSYIKTVVTANCQSKGYTEYLCRRCGDTYKIYDDTYEAPDSFYIVAKSVRDDETLTLTLTLELYNNPGLSSARLPVGYNASTLAFRELQNGDIWTQKDIKYLDTTKNPLSFSTEDYTTPDLTNKNNGHYFTVIFDIIDPEGTYGFYFPYLSGDFPLWDHDTNTIIKQSPTFINLVGKSELGDHVYSNTVTPPTCNEGGYTSGVCTLCSHEATFDYTEKTNDHDWHFVRTISEPTVTSEGYDLYKCSFCHTEEAKAVPALERYMKGDINNDKKINSIDANILKRMILDPSNDPQRLDAADVNGDSKINGIDANLLCRKFIGLQ